MLGRKTYATKVETHCKCLVYCH